jgi:hypothetical protein
MHAILYDEVNFQNFSSLDYSKYIPVHTCMYRYVQVQTSTNQHTSFDHAPSALQRLRVSTERLAWSSLTVFFLIKVLSTFRPPTGRRGLPRPKFHSHVLKHLMLPSSTALFILLCRSGISRAHACIATALDMCNVPVDCVETQKQAAT